ncbi:sugar ABC transporter ATP-binding protein [Actinosynnema sp. ALI-1.44]|uniref:sugar ABC transporter ATP-binding protein n=1 Tax=Actinosynnema sp. ALI-1.44 TaxID=1933779 RepID=UPI00097C308E|nr:sugar ABC transporter ATP-binding protein [Actinosynnema sp. ALI-1.44]ONI71335.1 sugar ABC transporter ATP-binding protein [Actinosynnema sp. ALI-1.44]
MDNGVASLVGLLRISKSYGGVRACHDVDLTVRAGEVHALLGENGAGKSTLMRVLSGDLTDYTGTITVDGEPVRFHGPADAQRAGIAMIHQELDLVPGLSVAENIFLGREPRTPFGTLDRRAMLRETGNLLRRTGIDLDPRRHVGELRTGEQQLVSVAKALSLDAKVLIMDEPTSALSSAEVDRMFAVIGELRRSGAGIVYISHRMDEIGRIADRATVLRNGSVVAEFDARDMTADQAAEAMIGRPMRAMFTTHENVTSGEILLEVKDLVVPRARSGRRDPAGISLTVRRGEIVGLAGLLGAGRTELLETLFGAGGRWQGSVVFKGRSTGRRKPRSAIRAGVVYMPEDRRISGLALGHSVLANTVLSVVDRIARLGVVSRRRETAETTRIVRDLSIKLASVRDPVSALSGGNQQKVVLGRMLLTEPELLLLDEPTRGVDVGAKAEIYQLLGQAAQRGMGVLLASSELAELVGVCDRVVVLRGGRDVAELRTSQAGEAEVLAAAMGEVVAL